MRFRIARHSGFAAPADALELLLRRLGAQRDEASFAMIGSEIRVTWGGGDGDPGDWGTRAEIARRAVLDLICDVCERAPELESDWFAVSYVG
jgi:hypothetical protein